MCVMDKPALTPNMMKAYEAEQRRKDMEELKRMVLAYDLDEVIDMAREAWDDALYEEGDAHADDAYNDPRHNLAAELNRRERGET